MNIVMKTKTNLVAAIILLGIAFLPMVSLAQQLPEYSHYQNNPYLINPAVAGSIEQTPVYLTTRKQWMGFGKGAPSTTVLSAHKRVDNTAIGGYVFNDNFGNISRNGANLTYAYHARLNDEMQLSFAVSGSICKYNHDQSEYEHIESGDPAIFQSKISTIIPNSDIGVYLYSNSFFAGLSAMQLLNSKMILGFDNQDKNYTVNHYNLYAGYILPASETLDIQPSVLLKSANLNNNEIDINIRATFNNSFFVGATYSTSSAVSVLLGMHHKNYSFGYVYDYSLSNLAKYSHGTHEVLLGIVF